MNTEKLFRYIYYGVIFLILIIAIVMLVNGPTEPAADVEAGTLLKMAMGLAYTVAIAAIVAFVLNIVRNFNESKGLVIGLVVLLVVFGIGYAMAKPDLLYAVTEFEPTDADRSLSRITGAGLKATFIIGGLTILASIYFGVKNILS
jgi:hypothetical protein